MQRKFLLVFIALLVSFSFAYGGEVTTTTINHSEMVTSSTKSTPSQLGKVEENSASFKISGGVSVSGFYETAAKGNGESGAGIQLTDLLIELSDENKYGAFDIAVGSIVAPTVIGSVGNVNFATVGNGFGLLWANVSIKPVSNLSVEAGILPTNVGYELANTFQNSNITYGLVWNSQPFIYKGVRVTYNAEKFSFYGEYDRGVELNGNANDHAWAIGSFGTLRSLNYSVTYFDYGNFKDLLDLTVGFSLESVDIGLSGDYQWLDSDKNLSGFGVAFYLVSKIKAFSFPLRLEYVKDRNNSAIYGFNKGALSVTITPTYKISDNLIFRVEYSFVNTQEKLFNGSKNKSTVSGEIACTF